MLTLTPLKLNLEGMKNNLLRQGIPDRVYFFEHGESSGFKEEIFKRFNLDSKISISGSSREFPWEKEIIIQRFLGHEIFRVWLPGAEFDVAGSTGIKENRWAEEHTGTISTFKDVESYKWLRPEKIDYSQLEWYERHLPKDMKVLHVTKVWEVVRELFGFENFCVELYEEPDLVDEVIRRVGEFHLALTRALCDFKCVLAVYGADDFGYKTSTMLQPEIIKEKFLTYHEKMAEIAHEHNKLYFFHCCGKIDSIMDAIIDDVRIDAKHSFEDTIEPVTETKKKWGNRVALLGGLGVDFIARSNESAIRKRVRETLDTCFPGGGYCLGLGNWVTDYIPIENYLVVLDEGRRYK